MGSADSIPRTHVCNRFEILHMRGDMMCPALPTSKVADCSMSPFTPCHGAVHHLSRAAGLGVLRPQCNPTNAIKSNATKHNLPVAPWASTDSTSHTHVCS